MKTPLRRSRTGVGALARIALSLALQLIPLAAKAQNSEAGDGAKPEPLRERHFLMRAAPTPAESALIASRQHQSDRLASSKSRFKLSHEGFEGYLTLADLGIIDSLLANQDTSVGVLRIVADV
jgi:hypothetical protein